MTPREKAEELVDKYDGLLTYIESKGKAKDCAMASVEEILDSILEAEYYIYNQKVEKIKPLKRVIGKL